MDNELFELCKEVFEKTGWEDTDTDLWHTRDGKIQPLFINQENRADMFYSPYYTSDYLLEKLPAEVYRDELIYRITVASKYGDEYKANYVTPSGIFYLFLEPEADTPLKALLKLCLALKEAGEL